MFSKETLLIDQNNGNKSCFRNERLGGVPFIYNENFVLPDHGFFECDFVYLLNAPHKDEQTSDEKIDMIKDLILTMEGNLENQIISFRALSEYLVISCEQLGSFVELIDDPQWKTEGFIAGVGRTYDIKNYDFIKKKWKFPETSKQIYNRFGIYNLFNPHRGTGSYRLDLEIYEERQVCKILLELAKTEGLKFMTNVVLDGKTFTEIDKEFVDKLPEEGIFEGSYVTTEDSADIEAREKLGRKYFDWTSDDQD